MPRFVVALAAPAIAGAFATAAGCGAFAEAPEAAEAGPQLDGAPADGPLPEDAGNPEGGPVIGCDVIAFSDDFERPSVLLGAWHRTSANGAGITLSFGPEAHGGTRSMFVSVNAVDAGPRYLAFERDVGATPGAKCVDIRFWLFVEVAPAPAMTVMALELFTPTAISIAASFTTITLSESRNSTSTQTRVLSSSPYVTAAWNSVRVLYDQRTAPTVRFWVNDAERTVAALQFQHEGAAVVRLGGLYPAAATNAGIYLDDFSAQ